MSRYKIDWQKAKQDFLLNRNTTLKDIALKYGISHSRIRKVSMKKGWVAEKKKIWEEVNKAALEEAQRMIIETVVQGIREASFK
jgi:uncharacterized protein YjcR